MRAYLIAIALLLLTVGGTAAYVGVGFVKLASADFSPPPIMTTAAVARQQPWRESVEAVGTIRAARGITLNAETSGDITDLFVESGQSVATGDRLLAIDNELEIASRARLRARLQLAEQLFNRDERLIKDNSIPQSQLDQSSADYRAALAELAEIDAVLKNKLIKAPFSGRLGILKVRLGDYVEAATPIVTLQDTSKLELDFSVPDRYAPLMKPGLAIILRTSAFPERRFDATLVAIDSQVDENTRNLLLRASIKNGEGLLPGMFARLTVDLDRIQQRVFVPETAITYSLQGDTVYVIEQDDDGLFVTPRVVKTAGVADGGVAIVAGLSETERVATSGQNKLYRGARVVIDDSGRI
ncbi:MAG: efflux RND transporter periplasmic adaptor subunit [Pseudomonadota bacterium]